MYDPQLVQPFRDELTSLGVVELLSPEDVEATLAESGTTLLFVNSVCGCAAAGAVLGAYGLMALDDRVLLWIMTFWLAVYLVHRAVKPEFRLAGRAAHIASPILATAAGVAQGATGMSAPVIATWIHSYRLQAETYVFGVSALFLAVSSAHLVAVAGFGLFDQERVLQGLLALIPVVVFVRLGMRMTRLISAKLFDRLIIGLIVVMEGKLVWQLIEGA